MIVLGVPVNPRELTEPEGVPDTVTVAGVPLKVEAIEPISAVTAPGTTNPAVDATNVG